MCFSIVPLQRNLGRLLGGMPSRPLVSCLLVMTHCDLSGILLNISHTNSLNTTQNQTCVCVFFSLCVCVCPCVPAFICHHNSFLIYGSLREPTLSNWSRVTHLSVGFAFLVSAAFSVAGYITFTGYTQGKHWSLYGHLKCEDVIQVWLTYII